MKKELLIKTLNECDLNFSINIDDNDEDGIIFTEDGYDDIIFSHLSYDYNLMEDEVIFPIIKWHNILKQARNSNQHPMLLLIFKNVVLIHSFKDIGSYYINDNGTIVSRYHITIPIEDCSLLKKIS